MQRVLVILRQVALVALTAVLVVGAPSVAGAHTDLDYTQPADGEQAGAPVGEITVAFSDPVTLVGAGFEVLTPAGVVVEPSVFSEDGAVYFLEMADPLAGGVAAVRYQVAAADGHVLDGGFSFTVPAAPTTALVTAPATVTPATSGAAAPPGEPATTAPPVITPAPTTTPPASVAVPVPVAGDGDNEGDDGGAGGILIGVVVAVVVLAGIAFLLLRTRLSSAT
jgi:methionine-rich copper-binding protein CopC